MNLRKIILYYSSFFAVAFICVLLGYRFFIDLPASYAAKNDFHKKEISIYRELLDKEINKIKVYNYDYAIWDSTYEFLKSKNELIHKEYIEESYLPDTFTSLGINAFIFIDQEDKLFWKGTYGLNNVDLNQFSNPAYASFFKPQDKGFNNIKNKHGFLFIKKQLFLFSSNEILKSNQTGIDVGFLVLLKKIDQSFFTELGDVLNFKVEFTNVADEHHDHQHINLYSNTHEKELTYNSKRTLNNIEGNEIVLLDIHHDPTDKVYFFTSNMVVFIVLVLFIPLITFVVLNKMLVIPLEEAIKDMKSMTKKGKIKPLKYNAKTTEFKDIIDNFNILSEKVNSHKDELKKLTLLDELTQIPNKRAFNIELENVFDSEEDNAIVMCDIDYFKKFNDTLGHLEGDKAIRIVAQQLLSTLKENEKVFRYGGEEFAIIINNTNKKELAKRLEIINRRILELEIEHPASDVSNFVTVSLGASIHNNNRSIDIIKKADEALYKSKEKGRNTYTII